MQTDAKKCGSLICASQRCCRRRSDSGAKILEKIWTGLVFESVTVRTSVAKVNTKGAKWLILKSKATCLRFPQK